MMKKALGLGLIAAGIAAAYAVTVPHTFVAGDPARAADVNANFAALATAVTALEDRVTAIEDNTVTVADLAGTYRIQTVGIDVNEGTNSHQVGGISFTGTVTLDASGSFTATGSDDSTQASTSSNPAGTAHAHTIPGGGGTDTATISSPISNVLVSVQRNTDGGGTDSGTWTLSNGQVTATSSSDSSQLTLSVASRNVLIGVNRESGTGSIEELYELVVLVRQPGVQ